MIYDSTNDKMKKEELARLFDSCMDEARDANTIPASAFENYRVKRGLREMDGTGVMAGVTNIGNVHGYVLYEGEKVADEGKLEYRGMDMSKLIDAFNAEDRYGFEEVIYLLLFGKLPSQSELADFNALLAGFGCAGTGGFGFIPNSMQYFTPFAQYVMATFIILFGVNFADETDR